MIFRITSQYFSNVGHNFYLNKVKYLSVYGQLMVQIVSSQLQAHWVLSLCTDGLLWIPQYEDLLSQFSSLQVVPSSSSQIVPLRSCSNIEQYIHDLDSNSFELDLQFSSEEKRLLLQKQTRGNPWYVTTFIQKLVFLLLNLHSG